MTDISTQIIQLTNELSSLDPKSGSFVNTLQINKIECNADNLRKQIITNPNLMYIKPQLHSLSKSITSKKFQLSQTTPNSQSQTNNKSQESKISVSPVKLDNNTSIDDLRRRLLQGGAKTTLDSSLSTPITTGAQNEYHSKLQQDIIEDMSYIVHKLKESATSFQEALGRDSELLEKTSESMMRNSGLLGVVGTDLNKFVKTGKIGFWGLLFAGIGLICGFFFILFIIWVFPKF